MIEIFKSALKRQDDHTGAMVYAPDWSSFKSSDKNMLTHDQARLILSSVFATEAEDTYLAPALRF